MIGEGGPARNESSSGDVPRLGVVPLGKSLYTVPRRVRYPSGHRYNRGAPGLAPPDRYIGRSLTGLYHARRAARISRRLERASVHGPFYSRAISKLLPRYEISKLLAPNSVHRGRMQRTHFHTRTTMGCSVGGMTICDTLSHGLAPLAVVECGSGRWSP